MKKGLVLAALLLSGVAYAGSETEGGAVGQTSDVLLIGIPVVALGLTFVMPQEPRGAALGFDLIHMEGSPRHDLGLALLRSGLTTYGLKFSVKEDRPNGEDNGSFPSGHTAITFTGAEFIRKEYGWGLGLPAYAAAAYTGWARVDTQEHYWWDVAAGAAIGILSNHDLSEIRTRWGDIRVGPAMFQPSNDIMRFEEKVPGFSPGLKMEYRF